MTLSGHKLGAPAGIGALFVRDSARIAPIVFGGPHESGMRAGTPNLFGAVAFGAAAEAAMNAMSAESERIDSLAASLLMRLRDAIPGSALERADSSAVSPTRSTSRFRVCWARAC